MCRPVAGVVVGLGERPERWRVPRVHLDGQLHEESGRRAMAELLAHTRPKARLLILLLQRQTLPWELWAVRAAGREPYVAIVGQNGWRPPGAEQPRELPGSLP